MTDQRTVSNTAWALLILLGVIWGGSFLAIRTAIDEIPPVTSVLHRCAWAMLVLWGVVALRGDAVPRAPRIWGAFLVMGVLNNVIPFTLMAWAQLSVEVGLTAILNGTTALFGAVVSALLLADERMTPRKAGGVALGLAGVAVAIGPAALKGFDPRAAGQLAILAGTLSYALASVWARLRLSDIRPLVAAAGMLTGSSVVMLPLALAVDGPPDLTLGLRTWGAIAYYAGISTAAAYVLYYRILALAGSANLMLVTLIIPPVSIALGAWARDETLAPTAYAGFALIACGLVVLDGRILRRAAKGV